MRESESESERGYIDVPVTTTVRSAIGDVVKTLAYNALEVDAEIPGIKNVGTASELSILVLAYNVTSPTLRRATV